MRRLILGAIVALAVQAAKDPRVADAAQSQDMASLRDLVAKKADINGTQPDGTTALTWAAHWDDTDAVKLLLSNGADPKVANRYGVSALTEACQNNNAEIVEALLKAGADPNTVSQEGETSLMTAARTGNLPGVRALIKYGADVNAKETWRGQTALMWAASENHPDVIRELLAHGADVNAKSNVFDFTGLKPKAGSVGMNFPRGGFTALLFAAREGNLESAKLLLDAGAKINVADPDGVTPLTISIINLHYDLANALIERGADVNASDGKGRSPLYAAIDIRNMDITNRPTPKFEDKLDALAIAKALIAKGANPNAQLTGVIQARAVLDGADRIMGPGATPFMRAARANDLTSMKLLIEAGANPKLRTASGTDAFLAAAGIAWRDGKTRTDEAEATASLQYLLDLGLNIDAQTDAGESALHGAAGRASEPIIAFLASKGANMNLKDKQGRTPLDLANGVGAELGGVRSANDAIVAVFKKYGGTSAQPVAQ